MSSNKLSYVCGESDKPLKYQTIGNLLRETAQVSGAKDALVSLHQDIRLSYADFDELVDQCAAGFLAFGLKPGVRVGIWSPNNAEWVITQFATARVGLILVNINPAYRLSELEYSLVQTGCEAIVIASKFKSCDYVEMIQKLAPEISSCAPGELKSAKLPDLRLVAVIGEEVPDGFLGFSDIAAEADNESRLEMLQLEEKLSPDDAINIQFTSGTTGLPKGATLSHFNIINNGQFCADRMNFGPDDKLCVPVPLYHCFGMVLGALACVNVGAAMILPEESFDPDSVLRAVQNERCTALYGVPTMFIAELDLPNFNSFDLSSLRTGVMAGSPCPVEVMKAVISRMNMAEVTIGYGMTELSPLSFQSLPTDSMDKRVGTVGKVHPFVETKIVDTEGRTLMCGQQGEIVSRGYLVMKGYWNDPDRTVEAIDPEGWMHTGDLGVIDHEGYCRITGRSKDMIIRGGENVYPREIEEYLYTHSSIADVQIFGVPNEKYGEEICAWIVLKPGESVTADDIKSFCADQIAHFKIPKFIKLVNEFPLTVTGKIQKFVMRDEMVREFELEEKDVT